MVLNEFVAYQDLATLIKTGQISPRAALIASRIPRSCSTSGIVASCMRAYSAACARLPMVASSAPRKRASAVMAEHPARARPDRRR